MNHNNEKDKNHRYEHKSTKTLTALYCKETNSDIIKFSAVLA